MRKLRLRFGKESYKAITAIALILVLSHAAVSQVDQEIDPAYAPQLTKPISSALSYFQLPDGKFLVRGNFRTLNGSLNGGMARLNADFTVDNGFNCSLCGTVERFAVQPDGKLLIAGNLIGVGGNFRFVRLNTDGSYDPTFNWPYAATLPDGSYNIVAVSPDGKIYVNFFQALGFRTETLTRLNPDGSVDSGFTSIGAVVHGANNYNQGFRQVIIMPDGRIMAAVWASLYVFNTDGTRDMSFQFPNLVMSSSPALPQIAKFALQSDGKIVFTGIFDTVNGVSTPSRLVRLNLDQGVDLNFNPALPPYPPTSAFIPNIYQYSDDKILVDRGLNTVDSFIKLNTNGTVDTAFALPSNMGVPTILGLNNQDRLTVSADFTGFGVKYGRLLSNGNFETFLNDPAFGVAGTVSHISVQSDGKAVVSGGFSKAGIANRGFIARMNSDGTTDTTFNSNPGFNFAPTALASRSDNSVFVGLNVIGGTYNGTTVQPLVKLNSDASLDTSFNPTFGAPFGAISAIVPLPDGKVLVGGNFGMVNGAAKVGIVRLNADGTTDTTFNTLISGQVNVLLLQPDGKIMMGGNFSGVNGFPRTHLARLNSDGSLDTTFNAGISTAVFDVSRISSGKYFIAAGFVTRRNNDGSFDSSFTHPTISGSVTKLLGYDDGTVIIGGSITNINGTPRSGIARLAPTGAPNGGFLPSGADAAVNALARQPDGKVLTGGEFGFIGGATRLGLARLTVNTFTTGKLFDFDGDGRADAVIYRPETNRWYILKSSNATVEEHTFGVAGDVIAPADFDGDGKTDIAIFRPSAGDWWYRSTVDGGQKSVHWGAAGDIPRPSDFDGDGRADYIVFRPSTNNWYRLGSSGAYSEGVFGLAGDKPVSGDFDGDGKSDRAIYRPATGDWWYWASTDNVQRAVRFGLAEDLPVPADYDGDGKTDFAVYRPTGGAWYMLKSSTGNAQFTAFPFGLNTDKPTPADYDGDGRADAAVWRGSEGVWYLLRSQAGFTGFQFGSNGDVPAENAFIQ
jgi:uncharacterized delta-60 repeat protein